METTKAAYEQAEKDGWIEYEPGKLRPPAPVAAESTADGGGVDDVAEVNEWMSRSPSAPTESLDELNAMEMFGLRSDRDAFLGIIERNEIELADLRSELASVQAQRDAAVAALEPFADAYHVYRDQFVDAYGDMLNWATDHWNGENLEANYKDAFDAVQALPAAAVPGEQ